MCTAKIWLVGLAVLVLAGCSGGGGASVTSPSEPLALVSTDEMADILMVSGEMSEESFDSELDEMEASGTRTRRFTRSQPCPAGGDITVEGTLELSRIGSAVEAEGRGVRTENDCGHDRSNGTVIVNGRARWEARFRRVNGEPQGPQLTRWKGRSTFTQSDGSERTCPVEMTVITNPSDGTRRREGTICGRPVSSGD